MTLSAAQTHAGATAARSGRVNPVRKVVGTIVHRSVGCYRNRLRTRMHPARFFGDLDSVEIDRPIFLLGTQGGGLTFISRILRRNPKVISETGDHRFWCGNDEIQDDFEDMLPQELSGVGRNTMVHRVYGTQRSWRYACDDLLGDYRLTEADVREELVQPLLRVIRLCLRVHGKGRPGLRFTDKSQSYTLKMPFLNAALAGTGPRFLLVMRNPYAMCQRAAAGLYGDLDIGHEAKLRLAAQHWSNSMRLALEDGERVEHFHVLRFEDLLGGAEAVIRRMCAGLDLEFAPQMIPKAGDRVPIGGMKDHKWYPLRPDVNDRYLAALKSGALEIIEPLVGDLARRFDYHPWAGGGEKKA